MRYVASSVLILLALGFANIVSSSNEGLLTLEISTPQLNFCQREPIPLTFKLSNTTAVPIMWNGSLDFGRSINLVMQSSDGKEIRYIGANGIDDSFVSGETMNSGKNKSETRLIDDNFAEQLFPKPGHYKLRVEFIYNDYTSGQREKKMIVSSPIQINIDEPKGINREAYDYLKNILQPARDGMDRSQELRLRQYFQSHLKASVYGRYKTFEIANIYMDLKQYQNAEDEFFSISDIDFFYSKRVDRRLDELCGLIGRPFARTKRPRDLTNISPGRPRVLPANMYPVRVTPIPAPVLIPQPTP